MADTTNLGLTKQDHGAPDWDEGLNENFDKLDAAIVQPGEPLTKVEGRDGGVAWEVPEVGEGFPVFAFRLFGDTEERLNLSPYGRIEFGNGQVQAPHSIGAQDEALLIQGVSKVKVTGFGTNPGDGLYLGNGTGARVGLHGVQPTPQLGAIADATDPASTQAGVNAILDVLRTKGIIAT